MQENGICGLLDLTIQRATRHQYQGSLLTHQYQGSLLTQHKHVPH